MPTETKVSKVVLTGGNGQLGSEIKMLVPQYPNIDFVFTDRSCFSLDNTVQMINFLNENKPHFLINCAAYTAVDKAESEKEIANQANNLAVGVMAQWCTENNCKLIHLSTDYVFDGTSSSPLTEKDTNQPINYYGTTKLLGELVCIQNNPEAIIIRTSWVYSQFGNNFVKTILRLMAERDTLNIVNDQIGSPTYAADLASAILMIISYPKWKSGIYNFSNEGVISWYDFAKEIQQISEIKCEINGISTSEFPTLAKRPNYSLLDKTKIKTTYNIDIPDYKESLKSCLSKILA